MPKRSSQQRRSASTATQQNGILVAGEKTTITFHSADEPLPFEPVLEALADVLIDVADQKRKQQPAA